MSIPTLVCSRHRSGQDRGVSGGHDLACSWQLQNEDVPVLVLHRSIGTLTQAPLVLLCFTCCSFLPVGGEPLRQQKADDSRCHDACPLAVSGGIPQHLQGLCVVGRGRGGGSLIKSDYLEI